MSFSLQLPTFSVETSQESTLYPSQQQADRHYQKYVDERVPCEFFRDGIKQKEYKPI